MNCVEQKLKQEVKEILEQYTTAKDNLVPILNDVKWNSHFTYNGR